MAKFEIADTQLKAAMTLYLEGDFVSAITIAGAAGEILGEICRQRGKQASLDRRAQKCRELFLRLGTQFPNMFRGDPGTKPFVNLRNETRNELKHFISGKPLEVDLREKAGRLIAHAIENYTTLVGSTTSQMRRFQEKRLGWNPPYDPALDAALPPLPNP